MDQLLKGTQLISLNLFQCQKPFSPPTRQLNRLHFLSTQPILTLVLFNLSFSFIFGGIVASVDDEVVFAGHSLLLEVFSEDFLQIEMQPHEIAEGLLA